MGSTGLKSYVYILSNKGKNVVYVGSTDDLKKRIYFHKKRLISGFTKKYNVDRLVSFEAFETSGEAVGREKQIKGYRREMGKMTGCHAGQFVSKPQNTN